MFITIIAIILIIAMIVLMSISKLKTIPIVGIVVGAVMLCCSLFITQVPTGFTGVLTTFGKVEDTTLSSGINFKLPWQKIIAMDNREQRSSFTFNAFSSDIQQTAVTGSINYKIDQQTAMTLYKSVGTNYSNTLIAPRLYEDTKVVFSRYTAENLISKRDILADEILELMKKDLEGYGINVISIAIEDIDFTDAFTNAIEAKQVATQEKLRAQTIQEQAVMEAEAEAKQRTIAAEADAEVARITAEAEAYSTSTKAAAEAEANAKINASLTPELIEYVQANNWNGQLPDTFVGADTDTIPILNVDK